MAEPTIEVKFTVPIGEVPPDDQAEAERKAQEAYVLVLLRRGHISAGQAAEMLGINRLGSLRPDVRARDLAA